MNRLSAAHWRGARRHPRRVASLDSLLVVDEVDSNTSDHFETFEMHEDTMAAETSSSQNSEQDRGTTQPHRQGGELRGEEVSQSNSSSSKIPPSTKKARFGLLRDWASEVTALVSAFGCLIAIYIILGKFNDQQQPDWPYARTLNLSTLIALIATLLRIAVEVILGSGKSPLLFIDYVNVVQVVLSAYVLMFPVQVSVNSNGAGSGLNQERFTMCRLSRMQVVAPGGRLFSYSHSLVCMYLVISHQGIFMCAIN